MTKSKMIKTLQELIKKFGEDCILFNFRDIWSLKEENDIRDKFTLKDLLIQFENQKGIFYNSYSTTSEFRDLEKKIRNISNKYFRCILSRFL